MALLRTGRWHQLTVLHALAQEEAEWNELLHESTAPSAPEAQGAPELPGGAAREQPAGDAAAQVVAVAEADGAAQQQEQCRDDAGDAGQPANAAQEAGKA